MLSRSFWRGRKVFLTGHTGFKGSWLALWLDAMAADVTGYALAPPTEPSLFEQAGVADCVRSTRADVRDFDRLKKAIGECQPSVIIHLAAQSVVRRAYDDPLETYATNVMGTVHVVEAVRQLRRPCIVVIVTSDKCYANQEWCWGYRENDPMGGGEAYGNSKGCAELVTGAYRESYFPAASFQRHGVALASVRAGNVVGGGDWTSDQLIPDLMRAFLAGEACQIRNPAAIRPWQFVLEPLHGYLLLCERLAQDASRFAGGWNFGPAETDARPVAWVADALARAWGRGAAWVHDRRGHPREAQLLRLDTAKARSGLDWHPALPLADSIGWIVDWYRAFAQGADLGAVTRGQIARYDELLQHAGNGAAVPAKARRMPAPV